jgi:hypothetical protein
LFLLIGILIGNNRLSIGFLNKKLHIEDTVLILYNNPDEEKPLFT